MARTRRRFLSAGPPAPPAPAGVPRIDSMSKRELQALAKKRGLKGVSQMNKTQLRAALAAQEE